MIIHNGPKSGHIDGSDFADEIYGEGGDDQIGGHGGGDYINGGEGKDHLHGGGGHDTLVGGPQGDLFVFKEFGSRVSDKIKDFGHGNDHIALDASDFTAFSDGNIASGEFRLGTAAQDANDHLIYDRSTGHLFYDPDGIGGAHQQLIATLSNHAALHLDSFKLFFD